MSDINDRIPDPVLRWGAIFNWRLSDAEVKEIIRKPPFPSDGKLHTVNKYGEDLFIDGHFIGRIDISKLT